MTPERKRLAFSLGLAAAAGLLGFAWLYLQERQLLHQSEGLQVLAAKRYLPAYSRLEPKDLVWMELPRAFAPTGVVTDAAAVLGLQTLVPFSADEPLIYNKLALGEQALAAAVPEGKRAVSLAVNAVTGLSGLLKAGDHVDVVLLHGQGAAASAGLLLQDVAVLAVGSNLTRSESGRNEANGTVTLALDPDETTLALAASSNGALQMVLRASGDARPIGGTRASFSDALRRLDRPAPRLAASAPVAAPAEPAKASPAEAAADDGFVPRKR